MGLLSSFFPGKEKPLPISLDQVYDSTIKDEPEPRMIAHHPRMADAIQAFLDEGASNRQLIFVFEEERKREPDYHLAYYWSALFNMKSRNYPVAMEILREGIARCRTKSPLCRELAECHFCVEDLEQSIYWFCTAIMAGDQTDFNPYLFIGYMCDAYGLKEEAWWARRRARGISYTMSQAALEYVPSDRDRIMDLALKKRTEKAEKMLQAFYLYASHVLGNL